MKAPHQFFVEGGKGYFVKRDWQFFFLVKRETPVFIYVKRERQKSSRETWKAHICVQKTLKVNKYCKKPDLQWFGYKRWLIWIQIKNIFVADPQIGAIRLITKFLGGMRILEYLGELYQAFSIHHKHKQRKVYPFLKQVILWRTSLPFFSTHQW